MNRSSRLSRVTVSLPVLSVASAVTLALALSLVFFYAPLDAEQGFLQKIFYLHVPLAIVSLGGFVIAALLAVMHLRTRDPRWDMRSYVAIHIGLIFAVATLITGSIWARGSWGHWWVWSEPTLVSFLIVFLLYATYQPLRFAIEDSERQARYASVFAITAGAFVPMNFIAVRLATAYLHPRVLGSTSNLPPQMALTFVVSLVAIALLYATLCNAELTAKRTRMQLRALRRAAEARAGAGEHPGAVSRRARSAAPSLGTAGTLAAQAPRGGV
ncbi:MAG TPA: cytochrome c biogenesis protein CcsA [Solirubrobacteraceae bacterium]|nr:cytochrome c biogenesis protein CcsA [Solirubrobacteraceae bacterium]